MAALKDFNGDRSMTFARTDKGLVTAILDYETKISELLDRETYKKITQDPPSKTSNLLNREESC